MKNLALKMTIEFREGFAKKPFETDPVEVSDDFKVTPAVMEKAVSEITDTFDDRKFVYGISNGKLVTIATAIVAAITDFEMVER